MWVETFQKEEILIWKRSDFNISISLKIGWAEQAKDKHESMIE